VAELRPAIERHNEKKEIAVSNTSSTTSRSTTQRQMDREAILEFFREIYGDQRGFICLVLRGKGHFKGSGSYSFQSFSDRYFKWPGEAEAAVDLVFRQRRIDDVYFTPRLRRERSRRKDTATAGGCLFVDIDKVPTEEQRQRLDQLTSRRHYAVSSGTNDNIHLYLPLEGDATASEVTDLCRRLVLAVGGDAKWADNSLLRVPYTYNHKERARGGSSTPVLIAHDPAGSAWHKEEIEPLLPPLTPSQPSKRAARTPPVTKATKGVTRPARVSGLSQRLRTLRAEKSQVGSRSQHTFRLVLACIEEGHSLEVAVKIAEGHEPSVDKFGERLSDEVLRICSKHPHVGQTCLQASCANATSSGHNANRMAATSVSAYRSAVETAPWPPRRIAKRNILLAAC